MGWNLTSSLISAIGGAAAGSSLGPWGSVGGAVIGGVAGGLSEDPNDVARDEAQKNRDFQAEMSNTAHQREVKDLQAAGLNPLLSANSGASTPSGSMAQTFDKSTAEMQRAQMMANIAQISASSARTIAETKNVLANTRIAEANAQVAPEKAQADLNTAKANSAIAASEARQSAVRADYLDSPGGRTAYAAKQYGDAVGSWVNPLFCLCQLSI